jgi:hypothetical protein
MDRRDNPDFVTLSPATIKVPWYLDLVPIRCWCIRKQAAQILLSRDPETTQTAWRLGSFDLELVAKVSRVIEAWYEWPNGLFVPDDRCAIVFQPLGSVDDILGQDIDQIEREVIPGLDREKIWVGMDAISYGEFMGRLQSELTRTRG